MRARSVAPERLDHLAVDDPAAQRSRRDLQRLHRFMGTRSIVMRAMREMLLTQRLARRMRVLELGAGDGSLMLGVARSLSRVWRHVELTLLDRQALVAPATVAAYARNGWTVVTITDDALAWAADPAQGHWDLIVCNLFLHHFEGRELDSLLRAVAQRTERFLACEPRRAWGALAGSHLIGVIGANAVTREDAVLSVHAGFCGQELAALWPGPPQAWALQDYAAGLFSQCLRAERAPVRP
jgi:hypothetical protein